MVVIKKFSIKMCRLHIFIENFLMTFLQISYDLSLVIDHK